MSYENSKIRAVKRGKFDQLRYNNEVIELSFDNCIIQRGVYDNKFIRLDLSKAEGDRNSLLTIHDFIKEKYKANFSPLKYAAENKSWGDIVCKISHNVTWEPFEKFLKKGDKVNVILSPGAIGSFGWCLNVVKIQVV